mmetsp:Transcript_8879/g.28109  ORF Transcript_8879/g.28109 Transcript_8879/m.28109 type:complete len:224 (+) Transcript_8879:144-815(+)
MMKIILLSCAMAHAFGFTPLLVDEEYYPGCPGDFTIGISHGSSSDTSDICAYYSFDANKEPVCGDSACNSCKYGMWMCQPDNPPNIKLDTKSFNLFKSGGPSVMIDGAVVNKTFGHGLLSPQVLKKTTGCGQCYLIESIDMYSPGAACGPCCGESKCTQKYQVKILLYAVDNVLQVEKTSPEIGVAQFQLGPPSYEPAGCGDPTDGKWPFKFKRYTDPTIGCN